MSGFTKLVPEIIQSSIWNEPAEIRCVWIAMIATKDAVGYVRGDARTIARMANVSLEAATTSLKLFQEPDPTSHTPDNDGRRIAPAPGGWIILNNDIYRLPDETYRAKTKERVRKYRAKCNNVTLQETLQKRFPSASASVSASGTPEGVQGEGGCPIPVPFNPDHYDFKRVDGIISAVRKCRREYATLNAFSIGNICQNWKDVNVRAFLVRQWCLEQTAALEPDKNPVSYLNNYLAKRFAAPETKTIMAGLDRARRTV